MMKNDRMSIIVLFVVLAIVISIHQFLLYGVWFEYTDLHHETWIVACICLAFGLWMGGKNG